MKLRTILTIAVVFLPAATAPCAEDWITAPSYYTHDQSGRRVQQYTPIGPFYIYPQPDFVRSGYRHTRSSLQFGASVDHYHLVEEWGRPVRPYDEWRFPYRPYSAPYDQWGPPYGGLGYGFGFGAYPYYGYPYPVPGPWGPGGYPAGGNQPGGNPPGGNFPGGNFPGGNLPAFNRRPPPYPGYRPWFDDRYPAFDDRAPFRHQPHPIVP